MANCKMYGHLKYFNEMCAVFRTSVGKVHTNSMLYKRGAVYYNKYKPAGDPSFGEPGYFEREAAKLEFGPHYISQLNDLWRERDAIQRDLRFKRDDHLIAKYDGRWNLPEIDLKAPLLGYEDVEALKDAPDCVKKIYSLEYGDRKDFTDKCKKIILDKVRQGPLDRYIGGSYQARIAYQTALIRLWTKLLHDTPKRPSWLRHLILLTIMKRRKNLKLLQADNIEEFERVIKELNIFFVPEKRPEMIGPQTRKGWVEEQVRLKKEAMKERTLLAIKAKLDAEMPAFEKQMSERIAALDSEEQQLRARLEEITRVEVPAAVGDFHPSTVDSVSERIMHRDYYYKRRENS